MLEAFRRASRGAATAAWCALAGSLLLAGPADAAYLLNGGLDDGGSPVTTLGGHTAWSAATSWYQFTVVPGGLLTTSLLPSTDPTGGGDMLHVVTDSGYYVPAEQGNGFGQVFASLLPDATVSYDLDVVSGSVTAGIAEDVGYGIGVFTSNTPTTIGPTDGWIHIVNHQLPGELSTGVFFETETLGEGANYYVDRIAVSTPEPSTWAMLVVGFAGLGFAGYRAKQRRAVGTRPFAPELNQSGRVV